MIESKKTRTFLLKKYGETLKRIVIGCIITENDGKYTGRKKWKGELLNVRKMREEYR